MKGFADYKLLEISCSFQLPFYFFPSFTYSGILSFISMHKNFNLSDFIKKIKCFSSDSPYDTTTPLNTMMTG